MSFTIAGSTKRKNAKSCRYKTTNRVLSELPSRGPSHFFWPFLTYLPFVEVEDSSTSNLKLQMPSLFGITSKLYFMLSLSVECYWFSFLVRWNYSDYSACLVICKFLQYLKKGKRPFKNGLIVGDSAYKTNHKFLITPYLKNKIKKDKKRKKFNRRLCRARVFVECIIGQLKARFPCLKNGIRFQDMLKASK